VRRLTARKKRSRGLLTRGMRKTEVCLKWMESGLPPWGSGVSQTPNLRNAAYFRAPTTTNELESSPHEYPTQWQSCRQTGNGCRDYVQGKFRAPKVWSMKRIPNCSEAVAGPVGYPACAYRLCTDSPRRNAKHKQTLTSTGGDIVKRQQVKSVGQTGRVGVEILVPRGLARSPRHYSVLCGCVPTG